MKGDYQEWRDIPEFEGYQINEDGEIRELRSLKKTKAGNGDYYHFTLIREDGSKWKRQSNTFVDELFTTQEQADGKVVWKEVPEFNGKYFLSNKGDCVTIRPKKVTERNGKPYVVAIKGKNRVVSKILKEVFGEQ
ncbi:hypothetical protein [Photobacterium ganghwense]|uniref:hypothetical protein n=1 Tax=Photobacterium ganghwense TaxID=320778 RepID=UPI0039F11E46